MSSQTLHNSTTGSSRTSHKGGDGFHNDLGRQPEQVQSFKLVNDPAISNAGRLTYRYDGVVPGSKMFVEVVDPRLRMARHALRKNNILLPIPEFQVDKCYVLPIRPKEVSFSNLNNNVNVKFLEEMCKGYGTIQDAMIFYHPITQKHLGLAKVLFTTSSAAQKCTEKLHNTSSMGNIINVFLDDKGREREKLLKELTKDPKQAEFLPPTPNSYLPRDVLGLGFSSNASNASALQPQSDKPQASLTSPPLNSSCNHTPSYLSSRSFSTDQQSSNNNETAPANIHLLARSSSTSARINGGDGAPNDLSRPTSSDFTGKSDKNLATSEVTLQAIQHQQHLQRDPRPHLKSGSGFPKGPADSRFDRGSDKPIFFDKIPRDTREKQNFSNKEIKKPEKNRDWSYESDLKDRHSWNHRDNSKGDGWKDKYTSPYLKAKNERNRDKQDFYDNAYNKTSWSRSQKDHDAVISPKFQKFPDDAAEAVRAQSGYPGFEKCRKKSDDSLEKNGQLDSVPPNRYRAEPSFQKKVISGVSENFSDILANSDDNAVDSSHLFVQSRISEPVEAEEDKHESLESRIQALLGQNLPFTSPLSGSTTVPVPPTLFQKSLPQPPLPPLPIQNSYEAAPPPPLPPPLDVAPPPIDVVPPIPLFNYPPPSFNIPNQTLSLAPPVVPPNLSYPPPSQKLPIYPLPVGLAPPQSLDPNRPGMLIPWGIPRSSTPVPNVPVNIPPPHLAMEMVDLEKVHLQNLAISQKEEERAKFRKVENELVYQLKKVLAIDVTKKRIEVMAFQEFEEWWQNKLSEHNEKTLSSKPKLKPIPSQSTPQLKNGEQKAVSSLQIIPPPLFNPSEPARASSTATTTMTTLSGLFDESGSFAGGLLGLRNSRLTSMPSFRKKTEPPKKESEKEVNKSVRDENDDYEDEDDDDDDDLAKSKLQFKGPCTPEGSENEEPCSDRDSDSDSIVTTPPVRNNKNNHKLCKPPSPSPSPTASNKELVKNVKAKKTKKRAKMSVDKIAPKLERAIYSSSSESDLSRGSGGEDESEDLFDVDVMNLVKRSKEPVRKLTVYTSDEEEDDGDGQIKTAAKPTNVTIRRASYNSSSPSVSESDDSESEKDGEKRLDVRAVEKLPSKKQQPTKALQAGKKLPDSRNVRKSVKKDSTAKRSRAESKPRGRPASKKPRTGPKSTKDSDVRIYMKSPVGVKSKKSTNGMMLDGDDDDGMENESRISEDMRMTSIVGENAAFKNNRVQLSSPPLSYEEPQPTCGYLHLLSDVASGVKQAEVNNVDSSSLDKSGSVVGAGFEASLQGRADITADQENYVHDKITDKMPPGRGNDGQSNSGMTVSTVVSANNKTIVDQLRDHGYSLNPWTEVKSKKGRKPKNKPPVVLPQDYDSEGEETVSAWSGDENDSTCLPAHRSFVKTRPYLSEHNYYGGCSEDSSEESDSEVSVEINALNKFQIYVEQFDSEGKNPKLELELVPLIGENVVLQLEKPEEEKKINVVDDEEEEEEGEYHSSDDDRMIIDEGPDVKKSVAKKRTRSSSDLDVVEPASKKIKSERKSYNVKGNNRLPRELISLFPSSYRPPETKAVQFSKRDFKEESHILYQFITRGLDSEDANFIKLKYEWLLKREQEENMRQMQWLLQTKWVPHPVVTETELSPSKKGRKSNKRSYPEYHKSGSARTEGYYKISHQAKQYLKHAHVVDEQNPSSQLKSDDTALLPSSSSSSLLPSETSVDAMVRKRAQQNREARTEGRRWQNMLTTNLGEDVAEMLKFNQLQLRKKQLRFARSRIHDWGLFAMEPIAEGELVIEYVGQVIRQSVADLREKRYEADGIGSSYLFRIDHSTIVDATKFGNLSRFINHCCNPNCYAKIVSLDGVKRIVIYSRRDIEVNEEITYDYKFPIEDDKIPCLCGASGCRGTLN